MSQMAHPGIIAAAVTPREPNRISIFPQGLSPTLACAQAVIWYLKKTLALGLWFRFVRAKAGVFPLKVFWAPYPTILLLDLDCLAVNC